jgi:aldehyde dehydrogenase (NAD+)
MKTVTKHYIDGEFVGSHGREVMDIVNPSNGKVIARVTLADEEDTRRAIAAAKRAFVSFRQTTKEERANVLRRLHEVVAARVDNLTAAMVEEYGGVVRFAEPIVQAGANAFLATEKALQELPLTRSWNKTTVTRRRCRSDYALECERAVSLRQTCLGSRGGLHRGHQAQ